MSRASKYEKLPSTYTLFKNANQKLTFRQRGYTAPLLSTTSFEFLLCRILEIQSLDPRHHQDGK